MKTVGGIPSDFSAAQRKASVRFIGRDPDRFERVIKEFFKGTYRHNQRVAGALVDVVKKHPHLLNPYIKRFLVQLDQPDNYPAMTRNILRLLQFVKIPANLQGRAFNTGMRIMENPEELVAAKVFAMTMLSNISLAHPELKNEIRVVIESQYPYGTAAFRSRARRVQKSLED